MFAPVCKEANGKFFCLPSKIWHLMKFVEQLEPAKKNQKKCIESVACVAMLHEKFQLSDANIVQFHKC